MSVLDSTSSNKSYRVSYVFTGSYNSNIYYMVLQDLASFTVLQVINALTSHANCKLLQVFCYNSNMDLQDLATFTILQVMQALTSCSRRHPNVQTLMSRFNRNYDFWH